MSAGLALNGSKKVLKLSNATRLIPKWRKKLQMNSKSIFELTFFPYLCFDILWTFRYAISLMFIWHNFVSLHESSCTLKASGRHGLNVTFGFLIIFLVAANLLNLGLNPFFGCPFELNTFFSTRLLMNSSPVNRVFLIFQNCPLFLLNEC